MNEIDEKTLGNELYNQLAYICQWELLNWLRKALLNSLNLNRLNQLHTHCVSEITEREIQIYLQDLNGRYYVYER